MDARHRSGDFEAFPTPASPPRKGPLLRVGVRQLKPDHTRGLAAIGWQARQDIAVLRIGLGSCLYILSAIHLFSLFFKLPRTPDAESILKNTKDPLGGSFKRRALRGGGKT